MEDRSRETQDNIKLGERQKDRENMSSTRISKRLQE